ncbi:MAG: cytochrome c peroxidase, partial [Bilophila sp.]
TGEVVELNAPTVFNAVFHLRQFWNGRARDLQEQALDPPVDPREMGSGNWTEICNRLAQSASLQQEFMELYADGITAQNVGNALAEFEKTLITPNCRFDRYLKGDKNAISVIEKDGYALFKASRCATCHVGKALGGQSVEYLNLKADFYADRQVVPRPADMGVYTFTGREEDKFKFKVPSLRNTAETGPWYHDGKIKTLNEAVSLMGVYQCGITLEENAVELIVAFLHTLTGEYMGRAVRK